MKGRSTYILIGLITAVFAANSEILFRIQEESNMGTLVASGSELNSLYLPSDSGLPIIVNRKAPGASCFTFIRPSATTDDTSGRAIDELQLIVSDRVDRESICPRDKGSPGETSGMHSSGDFHINSLSSVRAPSHLHGLGLAYRPHLDGTDNISRPCFVTIKVANGDKIFNVVIEILDINDNRPSWETPELTLSLRDGDGIGTTIPLPLAMDEDVGRNSEITYSLEVDSTIWSDTRSNYLEGQTNSRGSNPFNWFELVKEQDSKSLVLPNSFFQSPPKLALKTKLEIDREDAPAMFNLVISARDSGNPPLEGRLKVTINITDVNDHSPVFEQTTYKLEVVSEDTPVGTTLLQLRAHDMDAGVNAKISYRFDKNGPPIMDTINNFFELTKEGHFKVKSRLNVDKIPGVLNLPTSVITVPVEAVDGAESPYSLTGRTTIQFHIADTNDESPNISIHSIHPFTSNVGLNGDVTTAVETTLQENGQPDQLIALVEVKDADLDGHDNVECKLTGQSSESFHLLKYGNTRGELSFMARLPLDRESQARIVVTILCRDSVDHVTRQAVGVNLLDVNDNAPQFERDVYDFSITEDDGEDKYIINVNGIQTRGRYLQDSSRLAKVFAADRDEGENSAITYSLAADPNDPLAVSSFAVNESTGILTAVLPIDRESKSWFRFLVVASDRGNPSLSGNALVLVKVQDINDNPSRFVQQTNGETGYHFALLENEPPGKSVGTVVAIDPDHEADIAWSGIHINDKAVPLQGFADRNSKASLSYYLGNSADSALFRINEYSGEITTRKSLDREIQSSYTIQVFVRDGHPSLVDNGVSSGTSKHQPARNRVHTTAVTVTVSVLDENDNSPIFIHPNSTNHLILLDPTTIPGRSLLQIQAMDPDDGDNGKLIYLIYDGDVDGIFDVDRSTGVLYLRGQIPRLTVEAMESKKQYEKSYKRTGLAASMHIQLSKASTVDAIVHPTYVLGLEACDRGLPSRCTRFPNLQIQIRMQAEKNSLPFGTDKIFQQGEKLPSDDYLWSPADWTTHSLAEQIIIGLTVFFVVSVFISLLVIFIVRGKPRSLTCLLTKSENHKIRSQPITTSSASEVEMLKHPGLMMMSPNEYSLTPASLAFLPESTWSVPVSPSTVMFDASNLNRSTSPNRINNHLGNGDCRSVYYSSHGGFPNHSSFAGQEALGPRQLSLFRNCLQNLQQSGEYQTLDPCTIPDLMNYSGQTYYEIAPRANTLQPSHSGISIQPRSAYRQPTVGSVLKTSFYHPPVQEESRLHHAIPMSFAASDEERQKLHSPESENELPSVINNSQKTKTLPKSVNFPKATFV